MSVFNHQDYLSDAIQSILNQTLTNWEFIIINDGSTDGSLEIIRHYEKLDSRIIVINQENMGLTKALNVGIKRSTGKYIARQDADDSSVLNRFEKQLYVLNEFKLDIVTSRAFGNKGVVPNKWILNFNQSDVLKTGNIFIHGTFFINRRVFDTQSYNENYLYAQDFKFILDLFENNFRVGYMVIPLYCLNNLSTSISNTKKYEQDKYVSLALNDYFGNNRYFSFINRKKSSFRRFWKLAFIIYFHILGKGRNIEIITED